MLFVRVTDQKRLIVYKSLFFGKDTGLIPIIIRFEEFFWGSEDQF